MFICCWPVYLISSSCFGLEVKILETLSYKFVAHLYKIYTMNIPAKFTNFGHLFPAVGFNPYFIFENAKMFIRVWLINRGND